MIDLHTHTTASDGTMSPIALVQHAKEKGLLAIAITDHDTMAGVAPALEEGKRIGIQVIPAVEISLDFATELHLLAYFSESTYHLFQPLLNELQQQRKERNPRMLANLNALGMALTEEDILCEAAGNIVGRLHFAKAMIKKGFAQTIEEAFQKYLQPGTPGYVPKENLSIEAGIQAVRVAKGIPVLAHPRYLKMTEQELRSFLAERLMPAGVLGMEALYSENTSEDTRCFMSIAQSLGLLITGGSDFHGANKPWIQIGVGKGNLNVDMSILEELRSKLKNLA